MHEKQGITSGRNPKRSAKGFKDQEPLAKRTSSKRDASTERPLYCWATLQKTIPLSTTITEATVAKEDNSSPSKQLKKSSTKINGVAISVEESCRDYVGLKVDSKPAIVSTRDCVLGKRSPACRNYQVEEDSKTEDPLCFDMFTPVKEENYKKQPDLFGLPLKKFKKMSLEPAEVTEASQDKKVSFGFIYFLNALFYQNCHFPSENVCRVYIKLLNFFLIIRIKLQTY